MSQATAEPELLIRNAKIYTGDPMRPNATALTVASGRIVAIGGDEISSSAGPRTLRIDAQGRRLIPGLCDSHLHVIRGGLNYALELRWDGVPTLRQALAMLAEQAAHTPPGQWVRVVGGWGPLQFAEGRGPTLHELNAHAPDTPVFVLQLYQSAMLNRSALTAIGYTAATPDPAGGQLVRTRRGDPTGLLIAAPAATLLYSTLGAAPKLGPADQLTSTRAFLRELNRFGLTSAIDAAGGFQAFPENYAAVTELARLGQLTLRIAYHLFPQTAGRELADLREWTQTLQPGGGDHWLRLNGAGENLVWSAADFENFAQPRPNLGPYEADLETAMRLLLDHGWGFRLHATYDETISRDLDVLERVVGDGPLPSGTRWLFDHAETVSNRSLDRIAALGGSIAVQNRLLFSGETFISRYGEAAVAAAPPIAAMLERGITVAAGTDATRVSSYNPWLSLAWLVNAKTIGATRLRPSGYVDRATALQMYTRNGASLTGEQDSKGVLAPGYLADLAVLSDDYFAVPDDQIQYIESLLTVVDGRVVYSAGDFDGLDDQPAPEVTPSWSPVRRFGGYFSRAGGAGVDYAAGLAAAITDYMAEHPPQVPSERAASPIDPCFGP